MTDSSKKLMDCLTRIKQAPDVEAMRQLIVEAPWRDFSKQEMAQVTNALRCSRIFVQAKQSGVLSAPHGITIEKSKTSVGAAVTTEQAVALGIYPVQFRDTAIPDASYRR